MCPIVWGFDKKPLFKYRCYCAYEHSSHWFSGLFPVKGWSYSNENSFKVVVFKWVRLVQAKHWRRKWWCGYECEAMELSAGTLLFTLIFDRVSVWEIVGTNLHLKLTPFKPLFILTSSRIISLFFMGVPNTCLLVQFKPTLEPWKLSVRRNSNSDGRSFAVFLRSLWKECFHLNHKVYLLNLFLILLQSFEACVVRAYLNNVFSSI